MKSFRSRQLFVHAILIMIGALPFVSTGSAGAQGKLVAAVLSSDINRYREAHRAFVKTMAQKGYDQSNLEIIVQNPNPDPISWANSVRKFKALRADVIITYGAPATMAAMREVSDIPIVFVDVYSPVESGISRSLSRSGRNLTGISSRVPMTTLIKMYQDIKLLKTLGVIYSSREVGSEVQLKEIKRLAAQEGFGVVEVNALSTATLDGALSALLPQVDCIYLSEASAGARTIEKIIHRAGAAKIPVISQVPDASEKGALVSLEVNPEEQGSVAGEYTVKILSGKNPGLLPISTPRKVELVVNMKTAKLLGLSIPLQVLGAANRIIK